MNIVPLFPEAVHLKLPEISTSKVIASELDNVVDGVRVVGADDLEQKEDICEEEM